MVAMEEVVAVAVVVVDAFISTISRLRLLVLLWLLLPTKMGEWKVGGQRAREDDAEHDGRAASPPPAPLPTLAVTLSPAPVMNPPVSPSCSGADTLASPPAGALRASVPCGGAVVISSSVFPLSISH